MDVRVKFPRTSLPPVPFPHYRDAMNINAFARQFLINAGAMLETIIFTVKFQWI